MLELRLRVFRVFFFFIRNDLLFKLLISETSQSDTWSMTDVLQSSVMMCVRDREKERGGAVEHCLEDVSDLEADVI